MRAALGFGSNIGDKQAYLEDAIARIDATPEITLIARSSLYRTEPWGITDQDWFLNACALVETTLSASALLARCLEVEQELGRVRDVRWGPRKIDIDVLVFGDARIDADGLTIPHPRIHERAFVLVPLAEIWPGAPVGAGLTAAGALKDCPDVDGVTRIS
ncbi:2-amino-4-hydroxy-6-hydroxymethyldihydropteridine diphosphokinase [Breoghania sp. L-A4]|nr:2-amino-4-hydroxy-6-hydroxymethyldihydropteridine diphosphokinase [Breoghania sp. L-A4]AXS42335.1 2-amino-4-hydroxy-6-hydroxymethyldihydropteridine diphosphokinase [Breoghania sp. L-A4]